MLKTKKDVRYNFRNLCPHKKSQGFSIGWGQNQPGSSHLYAIAVWAADPPADWRKVWLNLLGCERQAWRFQRFTKKKQRTTILGDVRGIWTFESSDIDFGIVIC
jgi:hypothetical protein